MALRTHVDLCSVAYLCVIIVRYALCCCICVACFGVQTVELKVSMHCYGCAKKVQKHISKMDGMYSTDPLMFISTFVVVVAILL